MKLEPIDDFISYAGDTEQARYIINYAKHLECAKMYIEEKYTDKDYMMDYQSFYSRSFEEIPNTVKRVFFFSDKISSENLIGGEMSDDIVQELCAGFTSIKPVEDGKGNSIIGRTVLKHYDAGKRKVFLETKQHAHMVGREMNFKTLPFKCQDVAVGACASTALWVAMNGLKDHFDIPSMSLFEITEIASRYPTPNEGRMFPSKGLTHDQMCMFLHEMGLEADMVNLAEADNIDEDLVESVLKAFMPANISIIAGLNLKHGSGEDHHAVVISGYQVSNGGKISKIYVHDDQVGPYASVKSDDGFRTWIYDRKDIWRKYYDSVELEFLMVPLYHKIRLPFFTAWEFRNKAKRELQNVPSVRLANSSQYKKELREREPEKPTDLEQPMPKYVWIYTFESGNNFIDIIHDATSAYSRHICAICHK